MFQRLMHAIIRWASGERDRNGDPVLEGLNYVADQTADHLRGFHREVVDLTVNRMGSGRQDEALELAEIGGEILAAAQHLDRISCKVELLEINRRARERRIPAHG